MEQIKQTNVMAIFSLIGKLHTEGEHCDVTIIVNEKPFALHRFLLAAVFKYFDGMFKKDFKEGKMGGEPIVLHEVDEAAFRQLMNFAYTGDIITINDQNIYPLLKTNDYLGTRVDHVQEQCIKYLENSVHKNPISSALSTFKFVYGNGNHILINLLSQHICRHITYFSKDTQFMQFPLDMMIIILKSKCSSRCHEDSALLLAIIRWVHYNRQDRKQFYRELKKNVDFAKVSSQYTNYFVDEYEKFIDHFLLNENSQHKFLSSDDDDYDMKVESNDEVRMYVYAIYSEVPRMGVFSSFYSKWTLSCEFNSFGISVEMMRNSVMDNRLYCLDYLSRTAVQKDKFLQSFSVRTSICTLPNTYLKNPPRCLSQFNVCPLNQCIYVYDVRGEGKNGENILVYNCQLDDWFTIPPAKISTSNSSMIACHNELYLIGGVKCGTKTRLATKHVQAYDPRMKEWRNLPETTIPIIDGECCVLGKNICVVDITLRGYTKMEEYNPVAGKWINHGTSESDLSPRFWTSGRGFRLLSDTDNRLWLISLSYMEYDRLAYIYDDNAWHFCTPPLHEAIEKVRPFSSLCDAFIF